MSNATFTFRVDDGLKAAFANAAKAHDRTGAQLLRDFMRSDSRPHGCPWMMELLWTPEAIQEREDVCDYIEEDNPLTALALDDLIAEKTVVLQDFPRMGRGGRVPDTFELVIHSSYMVVYGIVETQVRILNVVHTAPVVAAAGSGESRQED